MWWADMTQTPLNDEVEVKYLHGEPLLFAMAELSTIKKHRTNLPMMSAS